MPDVTQRMLTRQLRELEDDQVVNRKIYAEVPPKVEYSLTNFGKTLEPVLRMIQAWGVEYIGQITQIRKQYAQELTPNLTPGKIKTPPSNRPNQS